MPAGAGSGSCSSRSPTPGTDKLNDRRFIDSYGPRPIGISQGWQGRPPSSAVGVAPAEDRLWGRTSGVLAQDTTGIERQGPASPQQRNLPRLPSLTPHIRTTCGAESCATPMRRHPCAQSVRTIRAVSRASEAALRERHRHGMTATEASATPMLSGHLACLAAVGCRRGCMMHLLDVDIAQRKH